MKTLEVSKDKFDCMFVEADDESYLPMTKNCIRCGRPIEDFDEFAPVYECDIHRRSIYRR
jgi:hypothetical protein